MKKEETRQPDFEGWATQANLKCTDGRVIMEDAFAHMDGKQVPIMWMHRHDDPDYCIGKAVLEYVKNKGMRFKGWLNGNNKAQSCKELLAHGDIASVSILANQLKEVAHKVMAGEIQELSMVVSPANPGAYIDNVLCHGADGELLYNDAGELMYDDTSAYIVCMIPPTLSDDTLAHSAETESREESESQEEDVDIENIDYVEEYQKMSPKEKAVCAAIAAAYLDEQGIVLGENSETSTEEGEETEMKHSGFDSASRPAIVPFTLEDQRNVIKMMTEDGMDLKTALKHAQKDGQVLMHSDETGVPVPYGSFPDSMMTSGDLGLFPDYKDVYPGMPHIIERDQSWVDSVINGAHKSPMSRIRTRAMDIRNAELRAKGYQKGKLKTMPGQMELLSRTTDPQTIYRVDGINRDDIVDIVDFDPIEYQYTIMRSNLREEVATAILIGDGRAAGSQDKIYESHIRSIYNDNEMFVIHTDLSEVDVTDLQGMETANHFGKSFIQAEKILRATLFAREKYKGSGNLTLYCTPRLKNVMRLSYDITGRRIYNDVNEMKAALDVADIQTVEQLEGVTRTDSEGHTYKLHGIMVNMNDYTIGCTKGGEITRFKDFNMRMNQLEQMIETRMSGALTRNWSAIVIEEKIS